jgi:hypothetical protein
MQDDQLLANLRERYDRDYADQLEQAGISTYRQFLAMLSDDSIDEPLRFHAFEAILRLGNLVDKRRIVSPMIAALKSSNERIRGEAVRAFGEIYARRAVPALVALLDDRSQPERVRIDTVYALCYMPDERAYPVVKRIMFDATDNLYLRSCTIEWLGHLAGDDAINNYIALLSDPESDVRFWAAFGLCHRDGDISAARSKLDEIVAFDHSLPEHWIWHTDREAMYPLEIIYFQSLESKADDSHYWQQYLISPAPEYNTFATQLAEWKHAGHAEEFPTPAVTLRIEPMWLADRMRERWPGVALNVREPRPQAYLLDWLLTFDNRTLIGALHRDQYAVVLTGDKDAVHEFAAWYRSVIDAEQPLFLYEWADFGVELKPGVGAEDLRQAGKTEPSN